MNIKLDLQHLETNRDVMAVPLSLVPTELPDKELTSGKDVQTLFVPDFFEWIEEQLFAEDWSVRSWALAGELLLWKPYEKLEFYRDAEEIKLELGFSEIEDLTDNYVVEIFDQLAEQCGSTDAPGLHILPLVWNECVHYLVAGMEFWQGGVAITWIGLALRVEQITHLLEKEGWYPVSQRPDTELINAWRQAVKDRLLP